MPLPEEAPTSHLWRIVFIWDPLVESTMERINQSSVLSSTVNRRLWQLENYNWLNIVNITLPLNQKFTDFCQIELGIHASIPSSWSQHNRKIFSSQGNTVKASNFDTGAETHNFPWRRTKITKCERCTVKKFDKQFFGQKKNILPFEWTICVKQNRRYNFFNKVFGTL